MERKEIIYFDKPGAGNTDLTLDLALERALQNKIEHLVVATSSGDTALRLLEKAQQCAFLGKLVAVTYHCGFNGGDSISLSSEAREKLTEAGVSIVMASHALSGINRSFREKFGGLSIPEVIAESYRRISQGFKVAVEVALMAADAGCVPTDREIISIGGSGRGADTALVLRAAHQNSFFKLKICEVLCFPKY
ncbi:MAG: uncharacterized protein PWP60_153 [Candidatus Atribacteria bacterium]|nr:uncharacterized protein [Candidatus Atribacteria bacterium]MDI3530304.1 uncharacterized protein [Candidatus Atribacteria bacterium]